MPSIIILEPESSGLSYVLSALELELEVYIFTQNKKSIDIPQDIRSKIAAIIDVEFNDFEGVLEKAINIKDLQAVIAGFEYLVPIASLLGEKLKLNYLNSSTAFTIRDKYRFRSHLTKSRLSDIEFFVIDIDKLDESFIEVPENFSFPAVMKPVDMAGSIGVKKIYNIPELIESLVEFKNNLPSDLGFKTNGKVIVEEYIQGKEYSVEGIVTRENTINIFSITEKILGEEPYFVEIGHIVGISHDTKIKDSIIKYVLEVIESTCLNIGPFHLEIRLRDNYSPIAIELAARLAGDHIIDLIKLSQGVDIPLLTLKEYLNIDYVHKIIDQNSISGIAFIHKGGKDVLLSIPDINYFKNQPEYQESSFFYEAGHVFSNEEDWSSRAGYIIFKSDNAQKIKQLLNKVYKDIKL